MFNMRNMMAAAALMAVAKFDVSAQTRNSFTLRGRQQHADTAKRKIKMYERKIRTCHNRDREKGRHVNQFPEFLRLEALNFASGKWEKIDAPR